MNSKFIVYHYPKCKKSRAGLEFVKNCGADPVIINYVEQGFAKDELRELLKKLDLPASELVRKQEEYYRDNLRHLDLSEDEWIKILTDNPKLIRRPVVVSGDKAVIADPPQNINVLLTSSAKQK